MGIYIFCVFSACRRSRLATHIYSQETRHTEASRLQCLPFLAIRLIWIMDIEEITISEVQAMWVHVHVAQCVTTFLSFVRFSQSPSTPSIVSAQIYSHVNDSTAFRSISHFYCYPHHDITMCNAWNLPAWQQTAILASSILLLLPSAVWKITIDKLRRKTYESSWKEWYSANKI